MDETDDGDADRCANGFQYDVVVAASAPDGADATLYAGSQLLGETTVVGATATFRDIQLDSAGETTLRVAVDEGRCEVEATVTVECAGAPTCTISAPTLSDTHPILNGVPVAQGGDRVSSTGSPYQVAFEVQTNIEDGQPVILDVGGSQVSTNASSGRAVFAGVTLQPDGEFTIAATCYAADGTQGTSAAGTYPVDTASPDLEVYKEQAGVVSALQSGDHWNPEDDADGNSGNGVQLRICGTTTADDALNLPASLGSGESNFCVAVGTGSPECVPAETDGVSGVGDGACVDVDCPGSGSFALTTTLRDEAGNPTAIEVTPLTCASTLPQVQFADPVGDSAPWSNPSLRILAYGNETATRKDIDNSRSGAQYDVVACTNATEGAAVLYAGLSGSTLSQLATGTLEADDGACAALTLPTMIRFSGVTLPQSVEDTSFHLATPTELRLEVTDTSNATGVGTIDLWVDSTLPSLRLVQPTGLCAEGSFINSATQVTRDLVFTSSLVPVTVAVDGPEGTSTAQGTVLNISTVTVADVPLDPGGYNSITATVEEPSGNVGTMTPSPCDVLVGENPPPVVTWESPLATSLLAGDTATGDDVIPDGDSDNSNGWQGTLRVCTDISGEPADITFSSDVTGILDTVSIDGVGCAETEVTLPEAVPLVLRAETSLVNGVQGVRSISVPVDVTVPDVPTGLTASVLDRRQTSFRLEWTAPNDGGQPAAEYEVRVSPDPISTQGEFDSAEVLEYTGDPSDAGEMDSLDVLSRYIENDYYFAIAAADIVGNASAFVATTEATKAEFNHDIIPSPVLGANERFGWRVDASGSINGDAYPDLCVGIRRYRRVYCYAGGVGGFADTPFTTITGSDDFFAASSLAMIGDINADGRDDLALGSQQANGVFVFYGRDDWTNDAALSQTDADLIVQGNTTGDANIQLFGQALTPLGDFNGDGVDDFAIGTPFYLGAGGDYRGHVTVVYGEAGLSGTILVPANDGKYSSGTLGIVGDLAGGQFGQTLLGLPGFYPGGTTPRSTLVVTAPAANSGAGRAYAFQGRGTSTSLVSASTRLHAIDGAAGQALGTRQPGVWRGAATGIVFPIDSASPTGELHIYTGTASTGPFATLAARFNDPERSAFARLAVSSAYAGSNTTTSYIGSSTNDVAICELGSPPRVAIVDGDKLTGSSVADIDSVADVFVNLPSDWSTDGGFGAWTTATDVNGDDYGDILIPEANTAGATSFDGRVIVLW